MTSRSIFAGITSSLILALGCTPEQNRSSQRVAAESLGDIDSLRPITSQNRTRDFILGNGMKVLLVSNPSRSHGSVALEVGVGSLAEPKEFPGIAHFLEHLLFLGTKTYPDKGGYSEYIQRNGGRSNAFTSRDHTNYHFEVVNDALETALDRFSKFFIEPTFAPESVDDERHAVNNEAAAIKDSDTWRKMIASYRLFAGDHPIQRYHPGDIDTLDKISREDVLEFYNRYYSAGRMNLVVDSSHDLDTLEQWVREKFSAVENRGDEELSYPYGSIDRTLLPAIIEGKSKSAKSQLSLEFTLPDRPERWKSKSQGVLSHIFGAESEGSLFSALRRRGLATSLYTSTHGERFHNNLSVVIELTKEGRRDINKVVGAVLGFAEMARSSKNLDSAGRESAKSDRMRFETLNDNGSSALKNTISMAGYMRDFPTAVAGNRSLIPYTVDVGDVRADLDAIRADNLFAFLMAPDVQGESKEPDMGLEYRVPVVTDEQLEEWGTCEFADLFAITSRGGFLPATLSRGDKGELSAPEQVLDSDWGTFWYQADTQIESFKSEARLKIYSDERSSSPEDAALAKVFTELFSVSTIEWRDMLDFAGFDYSFSPTLGGFQIRVGGYNDSLLSVLEAFVDRVLTVRFTAEDLELVKEKLRQRALSELVQPPVNQLVNRIGAARHLSEPDRLAYYYPERDVDHLSGINIDQMIRYRDRLFDKVAIEGECYGFVGRQELIESLGRIHDKMGTNVVPVESRTKPRDWELLRSPTMVIGLESDKVDLHAWVVYQQIGENTPASKTAVMMGAKFLHTHFFETLRTERKLAYIAGISPSIGRDYVGLTSYLQSSTHDPSALALEVNSWRIAAVDALQSWSDEDFEMQRQASLAVQRAPLLTLDLLNTALHKGAYERDGYFEHNADIVRAFEEIQKSTVVDIFVQALLNPNSGAIRATLESTSASE